MDMDVRTSRERVRRSAQAALCALALAGALACVVRADGPASRAGGPEARPVTTQHASDAEGRVIGSAPPKEGRGWTATLLALAAVAAVLLALRLLLKRLGAGRGGAGGAGPMRPVAAMNLSPRHQVHLVLLGRRLLVVGVSGERMTRLGEVTDPEEIDELLARSGKGGVRNAARQAGPKRTSDEDDWSLPPTGDAP